MRALQLLTALACCGLLAATAGATHPVLQLTVPMNGFNEVTDAGVPGQGDPDATGLAVLGLDDDAPGQLHYNVTYQNVTGRAISGLHIHGPGTTPQTNGPIFIPLPEIPIPFDPNGPSIGNGAIGGTLTEELLPGLTAKITQIRTNPFEFYINLHTAGTPVSYPNGAIRGQLPEPNVLWVACLAALGLRRRRTAAPVRA
jgi:hypothetical protein